MSELTNIVSILLKNLSEKNIFEKSSQLKNGDRVRITKGFFRGQTVTIQQINGDSACVVSPKWVNPNDIPLEYLESIR